MEEEKMLRAEMKEKVAGKMVKAAVQLSAMPNQKCMFLMGKSSKASELTLDDYAELSSFMKKPC